MCGANKRFFLYLLCALLPAFAAGVLRAGEPEPAAYMPMYLISETELLSIEQYRNSREAERQSWLSWVSALKLESGNLNSQLVKQREANRTLTESFNRYEQDLLTLISLKNGEIADLKQEVTDRTLEAAAYKGISRNRLVVIIALAASCIVFVALKVCRFFRLF
jgi:hypothetical protein